MVTPSARPRGMIVTLWTGSVLGILGLDWLGSGLLCVHSLCCLCVQTLHDCTLDDFTDACLDSFFHPVELGCKHLHVGLQGLHLGLDLCLHFGLDHGHKFLLHIFLEPDERIDCDC